jgi:hypothetical protein
MQSRALFIKKIHKTEYDKMFRDPITNDIITPALDILILELKKKNENQNNINNIQEQENNFATEINLSIQQPINPNPEFVTFITHHIPKDIYFENKNKVKSNKLKLIKLLRQKLKSDRLTFINYEYLKNLEFAKNYCIYHDRSINFGTIVNDVDNNNLNDINEREQISEIDNGKDTNISPKELKKDKNIRTNNIFYNYKVGFFNFNTNSSGTIIYDTEFNPLGMAFFSSFEFYMLTKTLNNYNLILPFDHIGVRYILSKYLDDDLILEEFLEENDISIKNTQINRCIKKINQNELEEEDCQILVTKTWRRGRRPKLPVPTKNQKRKITQRIKKYENKSPIKMNKKSKSGEKLLNKKRKK